MRHSHTNREFYNDALIVENSAFVIQSTVMVVVKLSTKQIEFVLRRKEIKEDILTEREMGKE